MNGGKGCCGYTHTHETVTEEKPGKPGQGFLGDLFDGALGFVGKVLEAPFKLAIKCSKVPIGLVGAIGKGLSGLSAGLLDGIGSIWK
ncbi:hypothetical protein A8L45_21045 [Veronia pacifica]|uniref:Uncharacterized protein n=2 Tax=Veronia pacifica TaxID=1080227 RepID=A0A1C3EA92_9GAMM|nr:hypothetical protein A8L45_21045 [Veronia pacifica]